MRPPKLLATLLATIAATLIVVAPAQAVPVPGQGTWKTTLQDRDLDGNGSIDAFYDTKLNITWLAKANTLGTWSEVNDWANGLEVGIYKDWRLPTMVDTGTPGCQRGEPDCQYNGGLNGGSEMASLYFHTLGNKSLCKPGTSDCTVPDYGLTNTGDFENMQSKEYWFGTGLAGLNEYGFPNALIFAWYFDMNAGRQAVNHKPQVHYAMAVFDGDGVSVPEPESLLLTLTALVGLGLVRRRRAG